MMTSVPGLSCDAALPSQVEQALAAASRQTGVELPVGLGEDDDQSRQDGAVVLVQQGRAASV